MDAHTAMLIVAASERDANLYYATRFLAPDSFVFMQTATQKILLMSDLEIDRAKQQSTVDVVLSSSAYDKKLKDQGMTEPKAADVIKALLDEFGLTDLIVPTSFGIELADALRERGFRISTRKEPFYPERAIKSPDEVQHVLHTMQATEEAIGHAVEVIKAADIRQGELYYEGQPLTSEFIKKLINVKLMENDCNTPSWPVGTMTATLITRAAVHFGRISRLSWTCSPNRRRPATTPTSPARSSKANPRTPYVESMTRSFKGRSWASKWSPRVPPARLFIPPFRTSLSAPAITPASSMSACRDSSMAQATVWAWRSMSRPASAEATILYSLDMWSRSNLASII
jgi:hypothetical protein